MQRWRNHLASCLFASLIAVFSLCSWLWSQEGIGPREGVVLLSNGRTLSGKVIRDGDRFIVIIPGGEIRLRASDVQTFSPDVAGCYKFLLSKQELGNADQHLDLAIWCLNHELFDEATRETESAALANPRHPRLVLVQRRIEAARDAATQRAEEENDSADAAPESAADAANGPSIEELEKLVQRLPAGAMETFTASVQPILQNNCTAAKCHGPQSESSLKLLRVVTSRIGGRRPTQRNLHSVLQFIDRERPSKSPLLQLPLAPHGGSKLPVFTTNDAIQYQQIYHWVLSVADNGGVAESSAPVDERSVLAQPGIAAPQATETAPPSQKFTEDSPRTIKRPSSKADNSSQSLTPARAELNRRESLADIPGAIEKVSPLDLPGDATAASSTKEKRAAPKEFSPQDPFDPEIFNRKYFSR